MSTIREHLEVVSATEEQEELSIIDLFEQVIPKLEKIPGPSKAGIPIKKQQDLVTFLKMHSHLFRVNAGMVSLIPIPIQNHLPSPTRSLIKPESPSGPQSLKQRVNNVVLKVLADNSDRDKTTCGSPTPSEDGVWRTNMFQRSKVVLNHRECLVIMEEIMRRGEAIGESYEF